MPTHSEPMPSNPTPSTAPMRSMTRATLVATIGLAASSCKPSSDEAAAPQPLPIDSPAYRPSAPVQAHERSPSAIPRPDNRSGDRQPHPIDTGADTAPVHPDQLAEIVRHSKRLVQSDPPRAASAAAAGIRGLFTIPEESADVEPALLNHDHLSQLGQLGGTILKTAPDEFADLRESLPTDFGDALLREMVIAQIEGDPSNLYDFIDSMPDTDTASAARWFAVEELHARHGLEAGLEQWSQLLGGDRRHDQRAIQRFKTVNLRPQNSTAPTL